MSELMTNPLDALTYATAAHAAIGHMRKYTEDPYIVHPIRVAGIVRDYGGTYRQYSLSQRRLDDMISAAYLHDVVEDTCITILNIETTFGSAIAAIVDGLTDISVPDDGNRATRKAMDRKHSAEATYEAQFVKCADIIDNASDIGEHDPSFNVVYCKEMVALLEVLDKVKGTPIYLAAKRATTAMNLRA